MAAAAFAAVVVAGTVVTAVDRAGRRTSRGAPSTATTIHPGANAPRAGDAAGGLQPSPPATLVPQETAVQQEDDQALAAGLAGSSTAAGAAMTPPPSVSAAWPAPAVSALPEPWIRGFVRGLLDIDFARQSRAGLGGWLSAEEAPELLPGVAAAVSDKVLYLSLMDPAAVGGGATPVPSAGAWATDSAAGVVWSASDLLIQADPQWAQIVATGWQPVDEHFSVEDVSGRLDVTDAGRTSAHRFSMAVYLGSAHWHPGYGTVLVNDWTES